MAYTYCRNKACRADVEAPTSRQVLLETWICECCGEPVAVDEQLKLAAMEDLLDRIEALEDMQEKNHAK